MLSYHERYFVQFSLIQSVHDRNKLVEQRQFACAPLSARAIAPNYLEWLGQSKIHVFDMQSFLLMKLVKFLI